MTPRERFLETLLFGAPDRIPFEPGGGRESTLAVWRSQGLPEGAAYLDIVHDRIDQERARRGLPPIERESNETEPTLDVSFRMIPTFEERVLEHRDGHYVVQDWMGAVTEIADTYDYTYIRTARDFVTRRWHKWPVESWDDWEEMKWRFDARDIRRFPADFEERCVVLRERRHPLVVHFNGPFWQLREFCGFEGLCTMTLEEPHLVESMASFWMEFTCAILERFFQHIVPDMLHISEDMAYKEHPMLSPEATDRFCGPCYRRWNEMLRSAGVPLFAVDSDGRVDELVPVWIDCGVNCIDPVEVAAGNDIVAMREAFGRKVSFRGGIDKRAMAAGGDVLRRELERIRPVVASGGYIPGCDHAVPGDVSWTGYQEYCISLAEMTGWLR